ncbi:Oxidoreductase family protein [Arachis hypogaea]|nr:Oxidoreductase family protein [Arachis hypogaea]
MSEMSGLGVSEFRNTNLHHSCAAITLFARAATLAPQISVPEGCDLIAVGALAVAFGTSQVAFVHRANLTSGQVLVVLGATGGVGLGGLQLFKLEKRVVPLSLLLLGILWS